MPSLSYMSPPKNPHKLNYKPRAQYGAYCTRDKFIIISNNSCESAPQYQTISLQSSKHYLEVGQGLTSDSKWEAEDAIPL